MPRKKEIKKEIEEIKEVQKEKCKHQSRIQKEGGVFCVNCGEKING